MFTAETKRNMEDWSIKSDIIHIIPEDALPDTASEVVDLGAVNLYVKQENSSPAQPSSPNQIVNQEENDNTAEVCYVLNFTNNLFL